MAQRKRKMLSARAKAVMDNQHVQMARLVELLEKQEETKHGLPDRDERELERLISAAEGSLCSANEPTMTHAAWKKNMSLVFLKSVQQHCCSNDAEADEASSLRMPVVYLDGTSLDMTHELKDHFPLSLQKKLELFVVVSEASEDKIKDEVDSIHVGDVHEALENKWDKVPFAGAYFDLRAGTAQAAEQCLRALLHQKRASHLVVGYTLTSQSSLGNGLVNELDRARRALIRLAHDAGYANVRRIEVDPAVHHKEAMQWQHQRSVTRFFVLD